MGEMRVVERADGFHLVLIINDGVRDVRREEVGPFPSMEAVDAAVEDFRQMAISLGAEEVPLRNRMS